MAKKISKHPSFNQHPITEDHKNNGSKVQTINNTLPKLMESQKSQHSTGDDRGMEAKVAVPKAPVLTFPLKGRSKYAGPSAPRKCKTTDSISKSSEDGKNGSLNNGNTPNGDDNNSNSATSHSSQVEDKSPNRGSGPGIVIKEVANGLPPLGNLLKMAWPHRQSLLAGPTLPVLVGNALVMAVPRRLMLTISTFSQSILEKDPDAKAITLPPNSVAGGPVRHLLDWARRMCSVPVPIPVESRNDLFHDIAIIHASRLLGMDRYTTGVLGNMRAMLKRDLPSYEALTKAESIATSSDDSLLTAFANPLAIQRYHNEIPDPELFAEYLKEHPMLAEAMDKIDEHYSMNRVQREKERAQRQMEWEQREAARQARKAAYEEQKVKWEEEQRLRQKRVKEGLYEVSGNGSRF